MIKRLKHMLVKEFLQLLRDPRMRMIIFVVPLLQMGVFAFALTTDVTDISIGVLDLDRTPASRALLADFTGGGYFEDSVHLESAREIAPLLDHGRVRAVFQVPAGFGGELNRGGTGRVQVIADGTDSNTTSIILGYANNIVLRHNAALATATGSPVEVQARAWFNPNLESKFFFVPGLIAVMILVISMILTSVAIVREREAGTIEQVLVTPIRSVEFILGKTIPYAIISYVVMTLMLVLAMVLFGVRIAGDAGLLYLLTGVFIIGNLGLALTISVTARTQQQAVLTSFMLMMPCVLLSGFMFPVANMPEPVQYLTWLNPVRWYIDIIRGVVIKGVGVAQLWPAILGQAALAFGFMSLAASRFKKTLV